MIFSDKGRPLLEHVPSVVAVQSLKTALFFVVVCRSLLGYYSICMSIEEYYYVVCCMLCYMVGFVSWSIVG